MERLPNELEAIQVKMRHVPIAIDPVDLAHRMTHVAVVSPSVAVH